MCPLSLWGLEDLEAQWNSIFPLNGRESRRVQTAERAVIKREVSVFYLPNGITHNVYVCPLIPGGMSTVTFLLWAPPGFLEGLLS